jgi:hypothetical protein
VRQPLPTERRFVRRDPDPAFNKFGGVVITKMKRLMVIRYITKNGSVFRGPPYTDAEVRDMFRRMQNGPRAMTVTGRFGAVKGQRTAGTEAASINRRTQGPVKT